MSAPAWGLRRARQLVAGVSRSRYMKHLRHVLRPGYGMGMGANTLIHKGGKP